MLHFYSLFFSFFSLFCQIKTYYLSDVNYPTDNPSQTDNPSCAYGQYSFVSNVLKFLNNTCVRNSRTYFQRAQLAICFFCHFFLFRRLKSFCYVKRWSFVPKLLIYRRFSIFRSWICDFVANKLKSREWVLSALVAQMRPFLLLFGADSIKCLCIWLCRFGVVRDNYYDVHSFCPTSTSMLR